MRRFDLHPPITISIKPDPVQFDAALALAYGVRALQPYQRAALLYLGFDLAATDAPSTASRSPSPAPAGEELDVAP